MPIPLEILCKLLLINHIILTTESYEQLDIPFYKNIKLLSHNSL